MRMAAVQLRPAVGDVAANLELARGLATAALADGAELVALPEFFTTGMANDPRLHAAALAPDGPATALLCELAAGSGALVGGSFLCADDDGEVRNAFVLAGPDGVVGRHDKDLPTMWENRFYRGGAPGDDGVLAVPGGPRVGAAMCWELMRSATPRRLRGRVDVLMGGSCWWSIPDWPPRAVTRRWEAANARTAALAPPSFSRLVGAPFAHAAICGPVDCGMPLTPLRYRGHTQGGAMVCGARGEVLAVRRREEGPGHVIADVEPAAVAPSEPVPEAFWLHPRGPMTAVAWTYQNAYGRRQYARRPAA